MQRSGGFDARVWVLVFCIACLWGLLMTLGFWQLQRAAEKEALLETSEQKMSRDPVVFDAAKRDFTELRYQRVYANGMFDGQRQFLLDNQVYKGRVGYHVLTPFVLEETGRVVMIDRGWVAANPDRRQLPEVSVMKDALRVTGNLYVPYGTQYSLGAMMDDTVSWPRVIQAADWDIISQALGVPVAPVLLRMDQQWDDGLVHEWVLVPFGPQKHIAYAVQWFAMAAVLLIMSVALYSRRRTST